MNRNRWTPVSENIFIAELRAGQTVDAAAQAAGHTRAGAYKRRRRVPDFAARWDEATGRADRTRPFDPVPRATKRHDGWTPERQRAFIHALADTGCQSRAARFVNMSPESAYALRRAPGAEGFRRAWDAALDLGVQRLRDIAWERAIEGQLVPVFVGGRLTGYRRKKNDRLLMFCLRMNARDATGRRGSETWFARRETQSILPQLAGGGGPLKAVEGPSPQALTLTRRGVGDALTLTPTSYTLAFSLTAPTLTPHARTPHHRTDAAAHLIQTFAPVPQSEADRAATQDALATQAAARAALPPAADPDEPYVSVHDAGHFAGELETGVRADERLPLPRGEHAWERLHDEDGMRAIDEAVERAKAAVDAAEPPTSALSPGTISPRTGKPVRPYKKRESKPPFVDPFG